MCIKTCMFIVYKLRQSVISSNYCASAHLMYVSQPVCVRMSIKFIHYIIPDAGEPLARYPSTPVGAAFLESLGYAGKTGRRFKSIDYKDGALEITIAGRLWSVSILRLYTILRRVTSHDRRPFIGTALDFQLPLLYAPNHFYKIKAEAEIKPYMERRIQLTNGQSWSV